MTRLVALLNTEGSKLRYAIDESWARGGSGSMELDRLMVSNALMCVGKSHAVGRRASALCIYSRQARVPRGAPSHTSTASRIGASQRCSSYRTCFAFAPDAEATCACIIRASYKGREHYERVSFEDLAWYNRVASASISLG
jgi:hypothetical protein